MGRVGMSTSPMIDAQRLSLMTPYARSSPNLYTEGKQAIALIFVYGGR